MSLSSRAKRYAEVHGTRAAAINSVKYVWRVCFEREDPVVARRRVLGLELHNRYDGVVQAGLLKGFRMCDDPTWGAADRGCMIAGLYEANVLSMLNDFSEQASTLIDIGAADGYFGVGTVATGMYSRSVCFERDPITREVLADAARINNVIDKVVILGSAGPSLLSDLQEVEVDLTQSVILCDIEGGEFELFNDELFEQFSQCRIIIELHDKMLPDGTERLKNLVSAANRHFTVTFLEGGERDPGKHPLLKSMPDDDKWLICSEGRMVEQRWMILMPMNNRVTS